MAYVPHGVQADALVGLRGYCTERLGVQPDVLDGMIEHASSEAVSLGESMTGRPVQ